MHKKLLKTLNSTDNTLYRIFFLISWPASETGFWLYWDLQRRKCWCHHGDWSSPEWFWELLQTTWEGSLSSPLHYLQHIQWSDFNRHICLHESQGNVYQKKKKNQWFKTMAKNQSSFLDNPQWFWPFSMIFKISTKLLQSFCLAKILNRSNVQHEPI